MPEPAAEIGDGTPVIACDSCGLAVPACLGGTRYGAGSEGEARLSELRDEGWLLTDTRDLCPPCATLERRR